MSADTQSSSASSRRRTWTAVVTRERVLGAWPWAPVGLAVIYALLLLRTFGAVVSSIYTNADVASAPAIGQLVSAATLWFEELTRSFPAHRELWEVGPWALTLIGFGLLAWAMWRVAGRWAALTAAVACACGGTSLLPVQFAASVHAISYVHICVLGAFMVPLALASEGWMTGRAWGHAAIVGLVAIVTGLGVASDSLVIIGGVVPFVVAGGILAYVSRREASRRVLASVIGVVAGAVVVAEVAKAVARAQHVVPYQFPITFAQFNQLLAHIGDLFESLAWIVNGNFGGQRFSLTSVLAFLCAALVLAASFAVLRYGRTRAVELVATPRGRGALTPVARARMAFVWFWLASALILSVAFVGSSVPVGAGTLRYVVPVAYALVILVAVAASTSPRRWRAAAVTGGVSVLIAGSILTIYQRQIEWWGTVQPNNTVASALLRFARSEHATVGYSGYWDAAPLTWDVAARLQVYPVLPCGTGMCAFPYHRISSWYTPRPTSPTLFIVDSDTAGTNGISGPPASFGTPERVAHFDQLTAYVYPYDIATKIAP